MSFTSPLAAFFGMSPVAWAMLAVFFSVALLTLIIAWGKVQPLIAFVLTSPIAALLLGMPLAEMPKADLRRPTTRDKLPAPPAAGKITLPSPPRV